MELLSNIVRETADSFGLGQKAGPLVAETARILFDERHGALQGFVGHLEQAGLKEEVAFWLNPQKPVKPLDPSVLETILGSASIQEIGKKLGLANARVRTAMAFVVPLLIRYFAKGERLPATLPPAMMLSLEQDYAGVITPRSLPVTPRRRRPKKAMSSMLGWGVGVLALLLSGLFLGLDILKNPAPPTSPPVQEATPVVVAPSEPPTVDTTRPQAKLFLRNEAGQFIFSGVLNSPEGRAGVIAQLQKFFGQAHLQGDLQIDPTLPAAPWSAIMDRILPQLNIPGVDVRIDGIAVRIGGWINEADRESVLRSLKAAMGTGYRYGYLRSEEVELSQDSKHLVLNQLATLQPGYKPQDLVNILNRWMIWFEEGSSVFPEDSREIVGQVAGILKTIDPPFMLEIGVHTLKQSSQSQTLKLANERALAVRDAFLQAGVPAYLVKSRGYGAEKPVMTDDQPSAFFWNQRVEFKVLQVCDVLFPCELTVPPKVPPREKPEPVELPSDVDPNRVETPPVRIRPTIRTLEGEVIAPRRSEPVDRSRVHQDEAVVTPKSGDSSSAKSPKRDSVAAPLSKEPLSKPDDAPPPRPKPKAKVTPPPPPKPKEPEWYDPFGLF